jgi:predicted RNase H-like HicB family nuclease
MQQEFTAIFERDGEWWIASAVEIPGAFSQGKTLEEARENLLDAVRELILAQRQLAEIETKDKQVIREALSLEV